mmetsp:Transcript_20701/g.33105  ORF Transcript_20701/g.33105 Transcript_20701/m.33105 type:complete len:107 (+) Transcript_20701:38-358(+)
MSALMQTVCLHIHDGVRAIASTSRFFGNSRFFRGCAAFSARLQALGLPPQCNSHFLARKLCERGGPRAGTAQKFLQCEHKSLRKQEFARGGNFSLNAAAEAPPPFL